jgi:hypothetical protein
LIGSIKVILVVLGLSIVMVFNTYGQRPKAEKYTLIKIVKRYDGTGKQYRIGAVDYKNIDRLNEPLRALAAYYSCRIQSDCTFDSTEHIICELTTALGLGQQGSDKQIAVLRKWFPDDEDVRSIIGDNCWVGMPGSSNFLEYRSLIFEAYNDTVAVNYQYIHYSHGDVSTIVKKDIVRIKKDQIVFVKR